MTDKNTRGRASKVDLLPPNIKTQLAMMLRDKHLSQAQILEEINDLIRDCGLDDSYQWNKWQAKFATRGKSPKFGRNNSVKHRRVILASY